MENYITNLNNAFAKLAKSEKEKIIKNKENNLDNFIEKVIEAKKHKISKENVLIIKTNFLQTLHDYAKNNQNTSKAYYYYTYNQNTSKTVHITSPTIKLLNEKVGIKFNNYYNEFSNSLDYGILHTCINMFDINHNIDIENKKNNIEA